MGPSNHRYHNPNRLTLQYARQLVHGWRALRIELLDLVAHLHVVDVERRLLDWKQRRSSSLLISNLTISGDHSLIIALLVAFDNLKR